MHSQAIRSADYDPERHELTIAFASGRTYVYGLVPADVAAALTASASPGAYHNAHIRDRYPYRRVQDSGRAGGRSLRDALEASRDAGDIGERRGR